MSLTSDATGSRPSAHEARGWVQTFGRWGWAAKGLVYTLVGLLALGVATGGSTGASGEEASRQGAIDKVAEQPWGGPLLVVLIVGLVLYAAWRVTSALSPGDTDAKAMAKRAGWLASAVLYLGLAYLAVDVLTSGSEASGGGGGSGAQGVTASVMEAAWGRWLVALAGLVALAVAAHTIKEAIDESYRERIDEGSMPDGLRKAVVPAGRAGLIGKGGAMGLIGAFLVKAAWEYDASEAKGLDQALRDTASGGLGTLLVLAIAVGLVLYGAYAFLTAPYRELERP